MSRMNQAISELKESLSFHTEDDISKLSSEEIVDYANQWIRDLEFENSLYRMAVASNITGVDFEKWSALAAEKFNQLQEGQEIEEQEFLDFLKLTKN